MSNTRISGAGPSLPSIQRDNPVPKTPEVANFVRVLTECFQDGIMVAKSCSGPDDEFYKMADAARAAFNSLKTPEEVNALLSKATAAVSGFKEEDERFVVVGSGPRGYYDDCPGEPILDYVTTMKTTQARTIPALKSIASTRLNEIRLDQKKQQQELRLKEKQQAEQQHIAQKLNKIQDIMED